MTHKLSIVTPSYNQGRFIERTIESVLSQQFSGSLEYLLIDGGSNDDTVAILRRYETCISWVPEKDGGQADAVNKGLARSTGEIIEWLNSDDVYYPGAMLAVYEAFESDSVLDVVYEDANHIDEDDRVIERCPTDDGDFSRLPNTGYICQAVFLRKSVVDRFGPLDATLQYCLDYEYWVRLTAAGAKFGRVRRVLAGSRLYSQNKALGSRVRVQTEINDMLLRYAGCVPDPWLFNYAHAVMDERGVPRSDRIRSPLLVGLLSLGSAVRWNRRITRTMAKTAWMWVGTSAHEFWKRTVGSR